MAPLAPAARLPAPPDRRHSEDLSQQSAARPCRYARTWPPPRRAGPAPARRGIAPSARARPAVGCRGRRPWSAPGPGGAVRWGRRVSRTLVFALAPTPVRAHVFAGGGSFHRRHGDRAKEAVEEDELKRQARELDGDRRHRSTGTPSEAESRLRVGDDDVRRLNAGEDVANTGSLIGGDRAAGGLATSEHNGIHGGTAVGATVAAGLAGPAAHAGERRERATGRGAGHIEPVPVLQAGIDGIRDGGEPRSLLQRLRCNVPLIETEAEIDEATRHDEQQECDERELDHGGALRVLAKPPEQPASSLNHGSRAPHGRG